MAGTLAISAKRKALSERHVRPKRTAADKVSAKWAILEPPLACVGNAGRVPGALYAAVDAKAVRNP